MKREQITHKVQKIKRFLTSKDLFVFLFFLVISICFWVLHALQKNHETTIQIPDLLRK